MKLLSLMSVLIFTSSAQADMFDQKLGAYLVEDKKVAIERCYESCEAGFIWENVDRSRLVEVSRSDANGVRTIEFLAYNETFTADGVRLQGPIKGKNVTLQLPLDLLNQAAYYKNRYGHSFLDVNVKVGNLTFAQDNCLKSTYLRETMDCRVVFNDRMYTVQMHVPDQKLTIK